MDLSKLQEVDVLCVWSPLKISVRMTSRRGDYHLLRERLNEFYKHLTPDVICQPSLLPGQCCVVEVKDNWYRAKVKNILTKGILVRLMDAGEEVQVNPESTRQLSPVFLKEKSCSFMVHLSQFTHVDEWRAKSDFITQRLREVVRGKAVMLLRRAEPETVEGQLSLPVEICWTEVNVPNPFLPEVRREVFVSQLLWKEVFYDGDIEAKVKREVCVDVKEIKLDTLSLSEASSVSELQSKYKEFRWLDPELPCHGKFYARGTYVDDCGQIYLQLYDQRHQFRELSDKLNKRYSNSPPDCAPDSFTQYQECIARYKDGRWYRARFLCYHPTSDEAFILFVDFGQTTKMKTRNLRCSLMCQDIPMFAFRTVLHNVLPSYGNKWADIMLDFMMDRINFERLGGRNVLKVQVESSQDTQPLLVKVQLGTNLDSSKGTTIWIDLAEILVKNGDAKFVSSDQLLTTEQTKLRNDSASDVGFTVPRIDKES